MMKKRDGADISFKTDMIIPGLFLLQDKRKWRGWEETEFHIMFTKVGRGDFLASADCVLGFSLIAHTLHRGLAGEWRFDCFFVMEKICSRYVKQS